MIDKPTIIITSLGRTGTKFFSILFSEIVSDSTSLHEPDSLRIGHGYYGIGDVARQIRTAGTRNLVRKGFGKWRIIEVSDARFRGTLDHPDAVDAVLRQRANYVKTQRGSVYIESNAGFYGLVDILADAFSYHRVAYMVRDGRDWVRSQMNWGEVYGKGRVRSLFAHTWPTPLETRDIRYQDKWPTMSRFSKLCWAWASLNEYALDALTENKSARLFRFEDIFKDREREAHLTEVVAYLTDLPGVQVRESSLSDWLNKPAHRSEQKFPPWSEWSTEYKEQFQIICGPLMDRLDYNYD